MRTEVLFKGNRNVLYSCKYHLVWCPTYRRPVLVNEVGTRLKAILLQTTQALRSAIIEREVVSDQVHLLGEVDPQFGINRLVGRLKGRSSRLLRHEFPHLKP